MRTLTGALRRARELASPTQLGRRLFAWWWWRSPNRPYIVDDAYQKLLDRVPASSRGLDLGSRQRVRPDAVCLDVVRAEGIDLVGDGRCLPFASGSFEYVWCNAMLEHVSDPWSVSQEIVRILKPGGMAFVQVPFLEGVHGWPDDYWRFTPNGLRELFPDLSEVACGVSAGPGQVLPDLVQYYATGFDDLPEGRLSTNVLAVLVGVWLLPLRLLDRWLQGRPAFWKWARAFYWVGRKPDSQQEGT